VAKKKVGGEEQKAPSPAKSVDAARMREAVEDWLKAQSAFSSEDPFEVVFQGRWPPQRKIATQLRLIHEMLHEFGKTARSIGLDAPSSLEGQIELSKAQYSLATTFASFWPSALGDLRGLLEEAKAPIGTSPEWREAYSLWCGLTLSLERVFPESILYQFVYLADTWCGPLALCAGRLAAAGNLGDPGPVTEWSPPMTRHRLASIFGVSEKTVDRWIERGEAERKGIKREGRGRFKLTIQALDSKSLERFRKAFPASK
jgi:hypothetical protein